MAARIGLPAQDCYVKTARAEQKGDYSEKVTARTGQPEGITRMRQAEQNRQNKTARPGPSEKDSQSRAARTRLRNRVCHIAGH